MYKLKIVGYGYGGNSFPPSTFAVEFEDNRLEIYK